MKTSIKFSRLEGYDDVEIESIPLNRNSIFSSITLPRARFICVLLTAIIILTLTLLAISLVVVFTQDNHEKPNDICDIDTPPLLVVSLDGFRPDYLDSGLVPTLYKISEKGVRADYLMSQFPTKTFPNHFTIATGLHPAWHGIVDNTFYDKTLNETFKVSSKDTNDPKWWFGTPIWKLAKDEGLISAIYYWPGSEVSNIEPNYFFPYQHDKLSKQLQQVNSWLLMPKERRPNLIMLYSYQPDSSTHSYGYYSHQMNKTLRNLDAELNVFISNTSVWNCVDKIFVSDHGFANVSVNKTLYLEDIINLALIFPVQQGPIITFNVINQSQTDMIIDMLKAYPKHGVSFDVYKSTGLPPRMHYGLTLRYCDVIVLNRVGWLMFYSRSSASSLSATHGWDNHAKDMRAFFIAQGPSFKHAYKQRAFENTHIFNLLTTLLRIKPLTNNGSIGALNDIISKDFNGNIPSVESPSYSNDTEIECKFPSHDAVITRVFCNECLCNSCNVTQQNQQYILSLDLSQTEINSNKYNLIPGGLPLGGGGSKYCYLVNGDSIIKYSLNLKVPVWTAYMVDNSDTTSQEIENCTILKDPRVPKEDSPFCSDYNQSNTTYSMVSLLPTRYARRGASLTTATLPLKYLPAFLLNHTLLRLQTHIGSTYVVVTGSVFISSTSGQRVSEDAWSIWLGNRLAIPSHVYQVIIPCTKVGEKCELDMNNVIGYIVENTDTVIDTNSLAEAYQLRMTTIREIERVSGVDFFPSLSNKQQLDVGLKLTTEFDL
ncbi:hypothetical protein LOD99_4178 [Oopsacas minuta]|uniref:ENPP1-3/EXOG-like endonuclease/phosphodiesterase domain-containing protein n=1 Tax=Oopsacas minuta TaxID=111878 RepID=A0AAV7JVE7_9METZ|nr:hypothetical protein LOD99_4178 [Oopsacas minuta]